MSLKCRPGQDETEQQLFGVDGTPELIDERTRKRTLILKQLVVAYFKPLPLVS